MKNVHWIFYGFILCFSLHFQGAPCEVYPGRQVLEDILNSGYQASVRPRCPGQPTVLVSIDMALRQIIEMNEPDQTIQTNVWLRVTWQDCRLTWNNTEKGLDSIIIPEELMWLPDLTLYDRSEKREKKEAGYRAIVSHTGSVRYMIPEVLTSLCRLETTFFPFDRQTCPLTFGMWAYTGQDVNVTNLNDHGDTSSYNVHTEWDLSDFIAVRDEGVFDDVSFPTVKYILHLRRKPLFYVVNLVLPCVLISLVSILAFLLPPDGGDKINLEVTVLLALSVFQLMVWDMMPADSESVPLISVYFVTNLVLVGLSCLLNVFIINICGKPDQGKKVPSIIRSLVINGLGAAVCVRKQDENLQRIYLELLDAKIAPATPREPVDENGNDDSDLKTLVDYHERIAEKLEELEPHLIQSSDDQDWFTVALILDRTFMVIYTLLTVLMYAIFLAEFCNQ